MSEVVFKQNDKGAFVLEENNERLAEMVVGLVGQELAVYHTGVLERLQGQGIGSQLVEALAAYARKNNLMVTTYCPFVQAAFRKNQEAYADIWKKGKPQLRSL